MTRELTDGPFTADCAEGWVFEYPMFKGLCGHGGIHLLKHNPRDFFMRVFQEDVGTVHSDVVSELQARLILLSPPAEVLRRYVAKGVPG